MLYFLVTHAFLMGGGVVLHNHILVLFMSKSRMLPVANDGARIDFLYTWIPGKRIRRF